MDGRTFMEVLREAGFGKVPGIDDRNATLDEVLDSAHKRATTGPGFHRYSAFIEPHIEGFNVLDRSQGRFGYVHSYSGFHQVRITFKGKS